MRRHVFVLFITGLFAVAIGKAQPLVTLKVESTPVTNVLQYFAEEYDLQLAYDVDLLAERSISISLDNLDVQTALYQVLEAAALDYLTLSETRLLIRPSNEPPPLKPVTISGRITDTSNGAPLPFATVLIKGKTIGTTADENGYYQLSWADTLKMPLVLESSYLGYATRSYRLSSARTQALNWRLQASPSSISTITITDKWPSIALSPKDQSISLRPSSILNSPGGQVDVMRSVQLLPGIAAHNDRSAGLNVRGSQGDENLMMWDGMLLYNVDHFFGAFGAINANMVEEVKLYKNTFPIEYGGRTASVLKIQGKKDLQTFRHTVGVGSLLLEGATQLPITPTMHLHIGGRATTNELGNSDLFQVLNQEVDLTGGLAQLVTNNEQVRVQPAFGFYDLNAKWQWQVSTNTYIDINAFNSQDAYQYEYNLEFRTRNQDRDLNNISTFKEKNDWSNEAVSMRWHQQWATNWKSEWSTGYSRYKLDEESDITTTRIFPDGNERRHGQALSRANELTTWYGNWKHYLQINEQQEWQFGLRTQRENSITSIINDTISVLGGDEGAWQSALYGAWNWESTDWQLQLGLHQTYYTGTKKWYASPRILANYQVDDQLLFKASLQANQQFLRSYYHENRFGRTVHVRSMAEGDRWPVSTTWQGMLGLTQRWSSLSLDIEAYYKHTDGVLEHTAIVNSLPEVEEPVGPPLNFSVFQGEGQVIGLDVLLRGEWKAYNTSLSYTLSRSTRQFEELFKGATYLSQDDRPHQLNWAHEYSQGNWTLSGVYVMASGRPYTDLAIVDLPPDRRDRSQADQRRIPAYHRFDLALQRQFNWSKLEAYASVSVFNLLNQDNILYSQRIVSVAQENNRKVLLGNELELLDRSVAILFGLRF